MNYSLTPPIGGVDFWEKDMDYIEVSIETPESELNTRSDELIALGINGVVIESENDFADFLENNHQYWDYVDDELAGKFKGVSRIKCYIEMNPEGEELLTELKNRYNVETKTVRDSDWENNWKAYYKPIEIGKKLLILPEWEELDKTERSVLRLDPGLMFGSGSHATTRMCLTALEDCASSGKRALDLGCGSGILGIGAIVLGCDAAVGCDIDPKAPDVVMSNAALNGIGKDRLRIYAGDIIGDASLRKSLGGGFDIVLANIVSDVIIPLAPYVRGFMSDEAVFITSGIIDGREQEVASALKASGFEILRHLNEEEWHCFVCR